MGGTIPYTVNPAVCWNTTWPSGSFKQSECFSSSESFNTCRLTHHSPFLSPTTPVSMTADIGPDRSVSEASVTEARWRHYSFFFFFFLQRGAWQCPVCCFSFFSKDAAASYDFNDNDPDPFPRYDSTNENKWVFCFLALPDLPLFIRPLCGSSVVIIGCVLIWAR